MTNQDIDEMARALKEILDKLDKAIVEAGKDANNVKLPFFYLRGGIDYSKLNFFFRKFLPIIGKDIAKDDKELLNLFKNGGDFVNKDNLKETLNYLK